MRTKILIVIACLWGGLSSFAGEVTGYLSLDYHKGQTDGAFSQGSFAFPLMGLVVTEEIAPSITGFAEFSVEEASRVRVEQAWVGIGSSDTFRLRFGLYLVPFGRYNLSNRPHQTLLVNSPLPVQFSFPSRWRDLGILVEGSFSGIQYSGYLGNGLREDVNLGEGQQFRDNNAEKAKGGRIGVVLGQGFMAGYSFYRGKYDDDNSRRLTIHGLDLTWMTEDWEILGEYVSGKGENPDSFSDSDLQGYFVQVALFFGRLKPVISFQKMKYQDPFHGQGYISGSAPGKGISTDIDRWTWGLVYAPVENVLFKVEYDINREKDGKKKNNLFAAQVALHF